MMDGSNSFCLLTKYKGRVYVGPGNANDTLFRFKYDCSKPEVLPLYFHGIADTKS